MANGLDQCTAGVGEVLPFVWGRMYSNLLTAGFSSHQAMGLIKTYILAAHGVHGLNIVVDGVEPVDDADN